MGHCLVRYGTPAFVGRFTCLHSLPRGSTAVIRSPRGMELGTVLCETVASHEQPTPVDGELIRPATPTDTQDAEYHRQRAHELTAAAERLISAERLPIVVVDGELLLDGRSAVIHVIPLAEADLGGILAELNRTFDVTTRLLDVSRTSVATDPKTKCSKPNCGSGGSCTSCGTGGGCGTSSCSRGAAKSAADLTAYFADLRKQMEADAGRRPLI